MNRRTRRALLAIGMIVLLDQILCWSFVTRPAGSLRTMIELTGDAAPPYFRLKASSDTTYSSWRIGNITHIHTNALGFRGADRSADRTPGTKRVIMTGDSITFGIGVDDADSFPEQLQRQIEARGRSDVEIWNAGVPGYAMADHLGTLRARLLPLHPDLVVLQLSRNDSALPMPLGPTFMNLLRFSGFARVWMIVRFNFVEDAPLFGETFRAYVDLCNAARVRLLLLYEGLPEKNEADVRSISLDRRLPLIEIGGDAYPKLPDDPHFSPEGNRRVAARILPDVIAALSEAPLSGVEGPR